MDEWSDENGKTLESTNPGSFQYAMENAFYGPLGELTIPVDQRNFATQDNLPTYPKKIAALRAEGAKLVTVFGIGRMMHIAFWEPHFAADFASSFLSDKIRIRRMEETVLPSRCKASSDDNRAECSYKLQEPYDSCSLQSKYDRTGSLPFLR